MRTPLRRTRRGTTLMPVMVLLGFLAGFLPAVPALAQYAIQITLTDVLREHQFGISVAASGPDFFVGAIGDDDHGAYAGAVHRYRMGETGLVEVDKLTASDGQSGDAFGAGLAASDRHLLVSTYGRHAVYVFERTGDRWTEQARLTPSDPERISWYGSALALQDDYAFVGARTTECPYFCRGTVFVYKRTDGQWVEQAHLTPSTPFGGDSFGYPLCLDGNTLVVGAHRDSERGDWSGAAYVFEREGDQWVEQARLIGSDTERADQFGRSLTCQDGVIITHAYSGGKTYAFERQTDGQWSQVSRLVIPGSPDFNQFLEPIILFDDYLLMTGSEDLQGLFFVGVVYVFKRDREAWHFVTKIQALEPGQGDGFGHAMAFSGDYVLIGSPWKDREFDEIGEAYLFKKQALGIESPISPSPAPAPELGFAQNYPNPFSGTTTIRYSLPMAADVRLRVYDALGRPVATLVEARQEAGVYAVDFDGQGLPPGAYFLQFRVDHYLFNRTMLLYR